MKTLHHWANLGALAFYLALAPFVHNLGQVESLDLLQGFAITAVVTLLALGVARFFSAEFDRVSLIAMAMLVYFFLYRDGWQMAASVHDGFGVNWIEENHFAALYLIFVPVPILLFRRWPRNLRAWPTIASAMVVGLLILPVSSFLSYQIGLQPVANHAGEKLELPEFQPNRLAAQTPPNVVFMVFDRYANGHVLREHFDYDNEPFLQALEQRNFFVARDSRSNYLRTAHSLAATLNVDYHDDLAEVIGPRSRDYQPLYDRIQTFTTAQFLQRQGYRFYNFGTYWGPTSQISIADENINVATLPDFATLLFDRSYLGVLDRVFHFIFAAEKSQCKRVPFKFKALRKHLAADGTPIFAFAHFLLPHTPYVFDAEGNCASRTTGQPTSYLEQLQYANKEILALLDHVRARARRPTVFVIQSDEGPFPREFAMNVKGFDWTEASERQLRKKTAILNAVFFPDGDYRSLSRDMTPVNIFRIIFNKFFGTQLPILPDRTYLHRDEVHLYDFHEITEKVRWPRD